jgi:hypothetical protein
MIKIQGQVIGAEKVIHNFGVIIPNKAAQRVKAAVRGLGLGFQRRVVEGLNMGRYGLQTDKGGLARSVNTKFSETADTFQSDTGTPKNYGRAWELGFSTPEYDIFPKRGGGLFWPGAAHPVKSVHRYARTNLARPWLMPEFKDYQPTIRDTLALAMRGL